MGCREPFAGSLGSGASLRFSCATCCSMLLRCCGWPLSFGGTVGAVEEETPSLAPGLWESLALFSEMSFLRRWKLVRVFSFIRWAKLSIVFWECMCRDSREWQVFVKSGWKRERTKQKVKEEKSAACTMAVNRAIAVIPAPLHFGTSRVPNRNANNRRNGPIRPADKRRRGNSKVTVRPKSNEHVDYPTA